MSKRTQKITAFIGSNRCFAIIMAFFVFEALWIALSGRYPMAFDENFHLGVIKLYAHHLSPFWQSQPSGADVFGAVFRDPSYLYQYLMSFPYRLISTLTDNRAAQVLFLRFINVALFACALPLYRRLLLKTGASRAMTHACLAFFILIPIAPLLAAQINYDNLLLPLTALTMLLVINFNSELTRYKRVNMQTLLGLAIIATLACLVKYAFLPIALVLAIFVLVQLHRAYPMRNKLWLSVGFGWSLMRRSTRWLLVLALLISFGLFVERYGINTVRYHKPIPDCGKVLSVSQCKAYPPWNRDYALSQTKGDTDTTDSPLVFSADWFYGMWLRSFFAVDGPASNFETRGPLILPSMGAIVFGVFGLVMGLAYSRQLLHRYNRQALGVFIAVIVVYAGALWLDGYQSFLQTGESVAINGRYLLPIMPPLILLLALGPNELLKRYQSAKSILVCLALLCMLWGGGTLTYIERSHDTWYWPNQSVQDINNAVRNTLGRITPGYYSPNEFMGRN